MPQEEVVRVLEGEGYADLAVVSPVEKKPRQGMQSMNSEDISMGGIKIAYHEQKNTNINFSELKVDLISDDRFVEAIPCKNAWNCKPMDSALSAAGDLRQCGIEFLDLTPNQAFLLKGFINRCAGPEINIARPDHPTARIQ